MNFSMVSTHLFIKNATAISGLKWSLSQLTCRQVTKIRQFRKYREVQALVKKGLEQSKYEYKEATGEEKTRRKGIQLMNGKVKKAAESLRHQDLRVNNRNKIQPCKIKYMLE